MPQILSACRPVKDIKIPETDILQNYIKEQNLARCDGFRFFRYMRYGKKRKFQILKELEKNFCQQNFETLGYWVWDFWDLLLITWLDNLNCKKCDCNLIFSLRSLLRFWPLQVKLFSKRYFSIFFSVYNNLQKLKLFTNCKTINIRKTPDQSHPGNYLRKWYHLKL